MARTPLRKAGNATGIPDQLWNSPYLKACRGEQGAVTPIWLMRQAGRYMAEYREVRANRTFLDMCYQPEIAAEVTVTAQRVIGADAAIIFADILLLLDGLGLNLTFIKGEGPKLNPPIRVPADVAKLGDARAAADSCKAVAAACNLTRRDLPADCPLIGFCGAPFTVAAYGIEGGGSRQFAETRRFMYTHTESWHEYCSKLVDTMIPYLQAQVDAGAQALQIFDSWAGTLTCKDYAEYALPHVVRLIDKLPDGIPVTLFGTDTHHLLPLLAEARPDVLGIDTTTDLAQAWDSLGGPDTIAVQGNLDPGLLLASRERLIAGADAVLDAVGDRPGHIFNLGHGVFKETDVNQVIALIDHVHQRTGG